MLPPGYEDGMEFPLRPRGWLHLRASSFFIGEVRGILKKKYRTFQVKKFYP
jgi:hypothetical protein